VTADDTVGDESADRGIFVAAVLDVVEGLRPGLESRLVLAVPIRYAGVEIPAVVIESRAVGDLSHVCQRHLLQNAESDYDVGDLDTRVVDVILDFNRDPAEPEHANQGVTECGVPEMPDVCCLVGIDRGVFDDGLSGAALDRRRGRRQALQQKCRPLEKKIQVPVGRGRYLPDPRECAERRGDFLSDGARRLAQPACQLERSGRSQIPEIPVGRVIQHRRRDRGRLQRVQGRDDLREVIAKTSMDWQNHYDGGRGQSLSRWWLRSIL
jgi:hypothetical protein